MTNGDASGADVAPQPANQAPKQGVLAELRRALAVPSGERPPSWEEETARLVALTSVDYMKQEDDAIALQDLALVNLAAARGCKGARKRVLDPARWRERPPPSLATGLESADEARAAIKALASLRAGWVINYVVAATNVLSLAPVRSDLLSWAAANSPNLETLLSSLNATWQDKADQDQSAVFDAAAFLLKPDVLTHYPLGDGFLAEVVDLVEHVHRTSASSGAPEQIRRRSTMQAQVISALDWITSIQPATALKPVVPGVLQSAAKLSTQWAAPTRQSLLHILARATNLAALVLTVGNEVAQASAKAMAAQFAAAIPASLALPRERDALLRLAIAEAATDRRQTMQFRDAEEMEQAVASLIPEWDIYAQAHAGEQEVQQLGRQIDKIAHLARIERFGVPGAVEAYDPFRHHLAESHGAPPLRIEVVRAGLRIVREDGTERVLLQALAAVHANSKGG
jgi:hypothetical protein